MRCAFHRDEAVRQAALARLAACAATGRLQAGHLAWSDTTSSAVGCLIGSDDLADWEAKLGLPSWFALVFETVAGGARDAAAAGKLATALLEAVPLGADLDHRGSALIVRLLDDATSIIAPSPLDPAVAAVMVQIVALHMRLLAGEEVGPDEWKVLRRTATGLTDALRDPLQAAVARCVESAAWDPLRSRTAALDTLRQWRNVHRDKDVADYGWGPDQDVVVQAQLNDLHARYLVTTGNPGGDVFKLYEEHHPDEATRLRAKLAFDRDNHWRLEALPAAIVLSFLYASQTE